VAAQPRIGILVSQYFGWGIYGGFGSMSRQLAEGLQRAGQQVLVIVPRRRSQQPTETINRVMVQSFAAGDLGEAIRLLRRAPVDIFHSQDPTLLSYLAQRVRPECVHLVTSRDPRDWRDWWIEFRYATNRRRLLMPFHYLTEAGPLVGRAVRAAQGVYCPAQGLRPKVQRLYRLKSPPGFLPNLIEVPPELAPKASRPTFIYVARFDKRKRPWLFFELARQFPEYQFIAVGQGSASAERGYDEQLRRQYAGLPNLKLTGLVNRFTEPERMSALLSQAWALVNTAAREGLPLTFLEAAAHGCAIVSEVDAEGMAARFGQRVEHGDFGQALQRLLRGAPLEKGREAREYVVAHHESGRALAAHLAVYQGFAEAD
jgi:glycosyltransferase involved in cell wall biosynthesis